MLKIKDNVDLKMLEKYGFVYDKELNQYVSDTLVVELCDVYLNGNKRIIFELINATGYLDTIYDLIQAGLVEKVEVKNNV